MLDKVDSVVMVMRSLRKNFEGRVCIATSFQRSGMVLLDICCKNNIKLPIVLTNTGYLFEETIDFAYDICRIWGLPLAEVWAKPSEKRALRFTLGDKPYEKDPDMCCRINKVRPFRRALEPYQAWVTAIRQDQSKSRAKTELLSFDADSKLKVCPLYDWTSKDILRYRLVHRVPEQVLYSQGYESIGCWPCTTPLNPGESEREGRWRGCGKIECGLHSDNGE